jgi:hypothetical protein
VERGGSRDPAPPSIAAAGEEGIGTLATQASDFRFDAL